MASVQINLSLKQMLCMSVCMPISTKIRRDLVSLTEDALLHSIHTPTNNYTHNRHAFRITHSRVPDTCTYFKCCMMTEGSPSITLCGNLLTRHPSTNMNSSLLHLQWQLIMQQLLVWTIIELSSFRISIFYHIFIYCFASRMMKYCD